MQPLLIHKINGSVSIVDDAYSRLAEVLNKIPNSFPQLEDGSHIELLRWIFSEREADIASRLKLVGETVDQIRNRTGLKMDNFGELLEVMREKGQISGWTSQEGFRKYALMPFAVGIYEEQLGRMDEEFAKRFEVFYQKGGFQEVLGTEPAIFRVIPVNAVVDTQLEIYPNEVAEKIIEGSRSWGVRECICKKQKKLIGQECKYPSTVCIVLAPNKENAFEDDELTTPIEKEEALKILHDAEQAGLVHCTSNIEQGFHYICNCCTCCCGVLRGISEFDYPYAVVKSNYVAAVASDMCTGCGTCIDRCQFHALGVPEGICTVDTRRCIGCGVCAVVCPEGALSLQSRPNSERTASPSDIIDWMTQKAMSRGIDPSDLL